VADAESKGKEVRPAAPAALPELASGVPAHPAVLRFDAASLRAPPPVAVAVPDDVAGASLRAEAILVWAALLSGRALPPAAADALVEAAARQRSPARLVESAVLRALAAAEAGDLYGALAGARQACRMAQAEALLEAECLAHLVLARLRRLAGRPHLGLHILLALARVAPPAWRSWIAWEMVLAGGARQAAPLLDSPAPGQDDPAARMARAALAFVAAVGAWDGAASASAGEALEAALPPWPSVAREGRCLLALLDARVPAPDADVVAWRRGEVAQVPLGLAGLGVTHDQPLGGEGTLACVHAAPGAPGIRVLRPGLPPAPTARNLEGVDEDGTGGARTETGLAALALAGPSGLVREEFFKAVYGFAFVAGRHQEVLNVLVHRMRTRLGDAGDIDRDQPQRRLALRLRVPVVVPDGRCEISAAERVLRALAALGAVGAQQTAEALRMPLRTVQRTLQQLVADGALATRRQGAHVLYRLQDTTFTSVTGARASAPAPVT
jgi:DNA-binding transcriptional ArsR family regulator